MNELDFQKLIQDPEKVIEKYKKRYQKYAIIGYAGHFALMTIMVGLIVDKKVGQLKR